MARIDLQIRIRALEGALKEATVKRVAAEVALEGQAAELETTKASAQNARSALVALAHDMVLLWWASRPPGASTGELPFTVMSQLSQVHVEAAALHIQEKCNPLSEKFDRWYCREGLNHIIGLWRRAIGEKL